MQNADTQTFPDPDTPVLLTPINQDSVTIAFIVAWDLRFRRLTVASVGTVNTTVANGNADPVDLLKVEIQMVT